jgi:hypothetical protein
MPPPALFALTPELVASIAEQYPGLTSLNLAGNRACALRCVRSGVLMRQAHVFLHFSYSEGVPVALQGA